MFVAANTNPARKGSIAGAFSDDKSIKSCMKPPKDRTPVAPANPIEAKKITFGNFSMPRVEEETKEED